MLQGPSNWDPSHSGTSADGYSGGGDPGRRRRTESLIPDVSTSDGNWRSEEEKRERLEEGTGRDEEESGRRPVLISSVRVCYNDDPLSLSLPPKYMSTWTTLGH